MPFSILLLLCAADLLQRIPEETFKILVNSVQEVKIVVFLEGSISSLVHSFVLLCYKYRVRVSKLQLKHNKILEETKNQKQLLLTKYSASKPTKALQNTCI